MQTAVERTRGPLLPRTPAGDPGPTSLLPKLLLLLHKLAVGGVFAVLQELMPAKRNSVPPIFRTPKPVESGRSGANHWVWVQGELVDGTLSIG